MADRPVYDPQVLARSRAMSTHAIPHVRNRRFVSADHFVTAWLSLEASVASARSSLGPMLSKLELGLVDVSGWAPEGYEPMDDLVECREVLRYCITQSCRADAWGEMHLPRPRMYWQAWYHRRVMREPDRDVCSRLNTMISAGEMCGEYLGTHSSVERWCRRVDGLIEGELVYRRALVPSAVREG